MEKIRLKHCRRVAAYVSLDAIAKNLQAMGALLPEKTAVMAVVKADGYGHGAVPVAKAVGPYAAGFGVATLEEAVALRRHGVEGLILILGVTFPEDYEELVRWNLRPAIFEKAQAERLSKLAQRFQREIPIHLAVDTGMSRIGMKPGGQAEQLAEEIYHMPGLKIEGIFTHFSRADEKDKECTREQFRAFMEFTGRLREKGIAIPLRHCSNSAALIENFSSNSLELCRAGISMYGLYPSDEVNRKLVKLTPALSLKSRISCIRTIEAGTAVSYGGTFVADRAMTIATIPVGYGDGYPRNLSGKGCVLIRGKRAPILGRICMDQFMVDISKIPEAGEEDEAVLIGSQGEETITVEELANMGGGFHYEILCDLGKRIPRVYLRDGQIVGIKDYSGDQYEDFL